MESSFDGADILRLSDVNDETSRFDKILAAPSDSSLRMMWMVSCFVTAFVVLSCLLVLCAILRKSEAKSSPFNYYVIFLVIPDLVLAALCFLSCLLNLVAGHYYSAWWCRFQSFYHVAGRANAWLNAFITMEIHRLLRAAANPREPYCPLNKAMVILQAILSYSWAVIISLLPNIDSLEIPLEARLQSGAEYDRESTVFKFVIFLPAVVVIPMIYVMYMTCSILYNGLLPSTGENKSLVIYFFRIIVVFYVMWLPALLSFFVLGPWLPLSVWWVGGQWSHLQGLVSSFVFILKPDIYEAVRELVELASRGVVVLPVREVPEEIERQRADTTMGDSNDDDLGWPKEDT